MFFARPAFSLFIVTPTLFGQAFEVASIRPSGPKSVRGSDGGRGGKDPTRYTIGKASLYNFILTAYTFGPCCETCSPTDST